MALSWGHWVLVHMFLGRVRSGQEEPDTGGLWPLPALSGCQGRNSAVAS